MERNVGSLDQNVRIVVGALAGLLSLATLGGQVGLPAIASPVLGIVAVVALVTGLSGTCGLYSVLGVSTCPAER
ncbi:DUF2892 domain-containing protein [Salinirubellus salinus]|uniref:DUF2892 domain-containing protein n=1 Tax=Salinirubellus salinus TaxID=1364945 RepID=A0A9E7U9L6_9EURY|nr:DUF2892 domain-containing protein [Salinirubellus salinus]UWM53343.1 DUF2892 domain-containing protein [Salinirubellus salinus]